MSQDSAIRERALNYLTAGASQEQTAKALGVEPSTISYLMSSDVAFADAVATADLGRRQKHNKHDDLASDLECDLLSRLKEASAGIYKPMELAKIYQIVNSGKRRGTSAPAGVNHANQQVINITLPTTILNRIKMTSQSQIVQAGNQELVTIQSKSVENLLAAHRETIDAGENHAATESQSSHHNVTELPSPGGSENVRIPAPTINGLTLAEQAVRSGLAKKIGSANESASSLGFGDD